MRGVACLYSSMLIVFMRGAVSGNQIKWLPDIFLHYDVPLGKVLLKSQLMMAVEAMTSTAPHTIQVASTDNRELSQDRWLSPLQPSHGVC